MYNTQEAIGKISSHVTIGGINTPATGLTIQAELENIVKRSLNMRDVIAGIRVSLVGPLPSSKDNDVPQPAPNCALSSLLIVSNVLGDIENELAFLQARL